MMDRRNTINYLHFNGMNQIWIFGGFLLGLGGSLHCLGMCGPLVMMIPFSTANGSNAKINRFLYYASKALGYGLIGILLSSIGLGISFITGQRILSILAAILIVLLVIPNSIKFQIPLINHISNHLSLVLRNLNSTGRWYQFGLAGMLNAFLPCGMVLVAATASLASDSLLLGFIFMFMFGLGTVPVLLSFELSKFLFTRRLKTTFQKASKSIAFILCIVLLYRSFVSHKHHATDEGQRSFISICKPVDQHE